MPELNKIKDLYTKKAAWYDFIFIRLIRRDLSLTDFFRRFDGFGSRLKILDAGAGSGLLTKILWSLDQKNFGGQATFQAFDFTPAMLERFRSWISQQASQNITLRQADAFNLKRELPSDWNNYDLIVSAGMFEYLPKTELPRVLKELHERLKPAGQLLFFITRRNWLTYLSVAKWWQANIFTREELGLILTEAGFQNFSFERFPYDWSNWSTLVVKIVKCQSTPIS